MPFRSNPRQQTGNRLCNRLRLDATAQLVLTHQTRTCLLLDVSATGARVRIDDGPARGREVMLRFHGLTLYCAVIWSRNGECGLQFERPLPLEDMQGMLWITQNRELYERVCLENRVQDWTA